MSLLEAVLKSVAVAYIFGVVTAYGFEYLATFSLLLAFVFGAVMVMQAFTTMVWLLQQAS